MNPRRRKNRFAAVLMSFFLLALFGCDDLRLQEEPQAPVGKRRVQPERRALLSPGHLDRQVELVAMDSCMRPQGLTLDRRGRLLVACSLLGEIQVIDPESMTVLETWGPYFEYFFQVDVAPGDRRVAAIGMAGRFFFLLDMQTGRLATRIKVGKGVSDMKRVPGTSLYLVSVTQDRKVAVLDAAAGTLVREISFPEPVGFLAVGQGGKIAAVSGGVYQVKKGRGRLVPGHIYLFSPDGGDEARMGRTLTTGSLSREPLFALDDTLLLVPNHGQATVSVFDVETRRLFRTLDVKEGPERLIPHPDGHEVYCLNTGEASISVIRLSPPTVIRDIPLPSPPEHGIVSPDGKYLVLTLPQRRVGDRREGNYLALIDLADYSLADLIPAGADPAAITQSADGRSIFVSNFEGNSISIFR